MHFTTSIFTSLTTAEYSVKWGRTVLTAVKMNNKHIVSASKQRMTVSEPMFLDCLLLISSPESYGYETNGSVANNTRQTDGRDLHVTRFELVKNA